MHWDWGVVCITGMPQIRAPFVNLCNRTIHVQKPRTTAAVANLRQCQPAPVESFLETGQLVSGDHDLGRDTSLQLQRAKQRRLQPLLKPLPATDFEMMGACLCGFHLAGRPRSLKPPSLPAARKPQPRTSLGRTPEALNRTTFFQLGQ